LSNIRSLPIAQEKILIGEYAVDRQAEQKAETLIKNDYPELMVVTTPEGKKQVPLQNIVTLDERFQTERDLSYKKGFEEGKQHGFSTGLDEGREDARQVVASLSGLLTDLTNQRGTLLVEAKDRILELILKISEKLTFSASAIDPEITMSIIVGAISQLLDKNKIKVKVNPDHLPVLEQNIDRFKGSDTAIKEFIFEPDARVRTGGCFIETPSGDIDARLESMYDVIKQSILSEKE
jgi:flagellar assembly protein FliH